MIAPVSKYVTVLDRELHYMEWGAAEKPKLVLWHGPPGTGKSHAVRALARAWADRFGATIELVLDPERLFGSADYMSQVLLSGPAADEMKQRVRRRLRARAGDDVRAGDDEQPLRLIVVEDAAFIATDVVRRDNALAFRLNTDEIVLAGPDHRLMARGEAETPALYLAVRRGCEARLNRSTWLQLVDLADDDLTVTSLGEYFALVPA